MPIDRRDPLPNKQNELFTSGRVLLHFLTMQVGGNLGLSAVTVSQKLLLVVQQLLSSLGCILEILGYKQD
jgi:hypothetical protein